MPSDLPGLTARRTDGPPHGGAAAVPGERGAGTGPARTGARGPAAAAVGAARGAVRKRAVVCRALVRTGRRTGRAAPAGR